MRVALLLLCLELAAFSSSKTCLADPQVDQVDRTEVIIERLQHPAAIEHKQSSEIVERQTGTEVILQNRGAAEVNYSSNKPQLERSNRTVSLSAPQAESGNDNPAVEENPDLVYRAMLTQGWEIYRDGDFEKAMEFFVRAAESGETDTRLQSELGIAYSLIQQEEKQQAIDRLASLVAQGYRLQTTSEALAPLLVESGRLDEAQKILKHLPESPQAAMKELIEEKRLQGRIEAALTAADLSLLSGTVSDYRSRLNSCRDTEYFYRAALAMIRLDAVPEAHELLKTLADCRPEDRDWQLRLLAQRLTGLDDQQLIEALHSYYGSELYGPELIKIGQGLLWQQIDSLEEGSPNLPSLVETLLLLDPEDRQARRMLAWSCYRQTDYECSKRSFNKLLEDSPSDADALEGLSLTLAKTGAVVEAVAEIESFSGEPGEAVLSLLVDFYALLGQQAYESEEYSAAAHYLAAALAHAPERRDLLGLLQWTRYRLGKTDGLVAFLYQEYERNPSQETAGTYLAILRDAGLTEKRVLFVADLAENSSSELRRLAAEDYFARGWILRAAETDDSEGTCYSGCNRPEIDSTFSTRMRNGEDGTSRLDAAACSADLKLEAEEGRRWHLRLTPLIIESGSAGDRPYVGSYYRSLADPDMQFKALTTGYSLIQPELGLILEGEPAWHLQVGMTPVGGPLTPMPTFSATVLDRQWRLTLSQESVRESVLSWVGLEDPYGGQDWGRVVRTGVNIRHSIDLQGPWWLSAEGEFHYYWGENVVDNQRLAAAISIGRTDPWHELSRAVGLFAGISGFEHNVNFFTYGHGGYYSPELMFIAGPFIRLTSKKCSRFWWDGQVSFGYSYRRTESAPRYRQTPGYTPGLSADADDDIAQVYEGTSESQLTVDARLRGLYQLEGPWFLGAEAGVNNSSDFTELQAAVFLRYRFGGGSALCVSAVQENTSFVPIR